MADSNMRTADEGTVAEMARALLVKLGSGWEMIRCPVGYYAEAGSKGEGVHPRTAMFLVSRGLIERVAPPPGHFSSETRYRLTQRGERVMVIERSKPSTARLDDIQCPACEARVAMCCAWCGAPYHIAVMSNGPAAAPSCLCAADGFGPLVRLSIGPE